jgi:hypothetical protein
MMNVQTSSYSDAGRRMPLAAPVGDFATQVVVRHLKTPGEIASVLHLREEIDLSVHAAAGPQFEVLEKKEMSAASSSGST